MIQQQQQQQLQQQFQTEQLVSNLPSDRQNYVQNISNNLQQNNQQNKQGQDGNTTNKNGANNNNYNQQVNEDNHLIMQLYKIKIPSQILQILKQYVQTQIRTPIANTPAQERKLSPRFGGRVSSMIINQQSSHIDLRSNATQLNASEEQLLEQQVKHSPTKSPVIAEETPIYINGKQAARTQNQSMEESRVRELSQDNQNMQVQINSDLSNVYAVNKINIQRDSMKAQTTIDYQHQSISDSMPLQRQTTQEIYESLTFSIKLTDLSDLENPFVIYENKKIDAEGYIIFDNLDWNVLNPTKMFPWLSSAKDLQKRTLKIEVTFQQELVLLRFIHLDKFYPIKFSQIMLEIANNMLQNQNLLIKQQQQLQKQNQGNNRISQSSAEDLIDLEQNMTKDETGGVLIMKRIENGESVIGQNLLQNERVKNSIDIINNEDASSRVQSYSHQSIVGGVGIVNNLYEHYFCLKPIQNSMLTLLQDLKNYRVVLKDLSSEIYNRNIDISPAQFQQLRIIIEYADCIIQAKDILQYEVLIDDNKKSSGINPRQTTKMINERNEAPYENRGGDGTTKISDLLANTNRPYSQGRTLGNRQNKCNNNFNPILLGKRLNSSNLSSQSTTNYSRTVTMPNGQNLKNMASLPNNSDYFDNPSQTNKSLIQKYGQNRSVQFYIRKELDAQLAQNRRQMYDKPQSAAAINMRDNRQIFRHMNDQNKVLSTQAMPLIYGGQASQMHQSMRMQRINYEQMLKAQKNGGRGGTFQQKSGLTNDMLKGEIDLEKHLRDGDDLLSNGDIPEFFQSVKSNSNGGFGPFSNQGDDQREYMNFPYSRAQDVLGASLATPSTFFKGNTITGAVGYNHHGMMTSSIIGKRKESRGRPGTQGGNQMINGNIYNPLTSQHIKNQSSLAYFDQANQIFGIQGKNSFY